MSSLEYSTSCQLLAALARREVSSRELLDHFLDRVAKVNESVNAVVTLDPQEARRAADAADEARARGADLGPLHGLPMTVKDTFETGGLRTTAGVPALSEHVPLHDAVSEPVRDEPPRPAPRHPAVREDRRIAGLLGRVLLVSV